MNNNIPYLHVSLGTDGNPEIEVSGSEHDQKLLCLALLAGLTQAYSADNPGHYLIGLSVGAAELLERMEETDHA